MEEPNQQQNELEIINLAINIFQNVGIKRWIDQIEVLKNEQIYFEICKIIFPETMIDLFRLTQNRQMSTGEKIQGVIDLIAKLIRNDLYHISGQAIAEGKLVHLKNFMQLLEALSSSPKDQLQIESAPQNDQSITYDDHHSYYTVIGIDKQFEKIEYSDQGDSQQQRRQNRQIRPQIRPDQNQEEEQSQDEFPIRSKIRRADNSQKGKVSKQVRFEAPIEKMPSVNKKTPSFTPSSQNARQLPYPIPLQENITYSQMHNQRCVNLISKMNDTKLNLQNERIQQMKQNFFTWESEFNFKNKQLTRQIEQESEVKKKFINNKIDWRYQILNSLKGEEQAANAIKDLFKQQRKVKMDQKKKTQQKQKINLKRIMNFQELDHLLRKAVMSNKSSRGQRQE